MVVMVIIFVFYYMVVLFANELVLFVQVSLSQNEVTVVQHRANAAEDSDFVQLISQLGFTASSPVNGCLAAIVDIEGMTCISCVRSIEACLSDVEGLKASYVSLSDNCAQLVVDSSIVSIQQICDVINNCGFIAKTRARSQNGVIPPVSNIEPDFSQNSVTTDRNGRESSCSKNVRDSISELRKAIEKEISEMGCEAKGDSVLYGLDLNTESDEVERTRCRDVKISVGGMTCDSCTKSVHSCISDLPGVSAVTVSLADNMAYVSLRGHATSADDVAAAVNDIGFDASVFHPPGHKSSIQPVANAEVLMEVHGMHCNSCIRAIEGQVSSAAGVHLVVVSLLDETAKIQYNSELISADQLMQLIEKAGDFKACISSENSKCAF